VTAFVDPSVQFGLQFPQRDGEATAPASVATEPVPAPIVDAPAAPAPAAEDRVVLLDKFRKK
jgi:hypothetical protein